jgi:UDP-glucose 4-epimerase
LTTALVTGVGGYVGGRLVKALLPAGWEVRGISRDPVPRLDIETTVLDVTTAERSELVASCRGADVVVHLAGENEVKAARAPAATMAATTVASERIAEAAAEAGTGRFVYMSTIHVYGARIEGGQTLTEDMRPEPRASYAIARLASEHLAAGIARDAFELVVLRLSNSIGAPDDPGVERWTLLANDLCRQGARDGRLELRTSGVQWRDFITLEDVCEIVAAASSPGGSVPSGTYNLASGASTTVRGLAGVVQDAFASIDGSRPELVAPDPEGPSPDPYRVSVDRLASCGLRATRSLESAVEETVRFCLEHRGELP